MKKHVPNLLTGRVQCATLDKNPEKGFLLYLIKKQRPQPFPAPHR